VRNWALLGGFGLLVILGVVMFSVDPETHDEPAVRSNEQQPSTPMLEQQSIAGAVLHELPIEQTLTAFLLGENTKDAFDKFIFDQETKDEKVVLAQYARHASTYFTVKSRDYAVDLFGRYVEYKIALSTQDVDIDNYNVSPSDIMATLDMRHEIRQQYFSQHEQAYLFGEDSAIDERAVERLRIANTTGLSDAQKRDAIFEQLNTLSEREKAPYQPTINMHRIAQIKALHDDNNSRFNALSAEFGSTVATRLVATWEQQEKWQQRVNSFISFKDGAMSSQQTAQEKQEAINTYLATHFTDNEIKRVIVAIGDS